MVDDHHPSKFPLNELQQVVGYHVSLISGAEKELEELDDELGLLMKLVKDAKEKHKNIDAFKGLEARIMGIIQDVQGTLNTFDTQIVTENTRNTLRPGSLKASLAELIKSVRDDKVKPLLESARIDLAKLCIADIPETSTEETRDIRQQNKKREIVGLGDETESKKPRVPPPLFIPKVREEMDNPFDQWLRYPQYLLGLTESQTCHLQFCSNIPQVIFTNSRVVADDGHPIKVVLYNSLSGEIVTSGPLSSLRVKIVVLDGNFSPDDQKDWTKKKFEQNIVHCREGRRPLVSGDLMVTLQDGVGFISEIAFTDNSSWVRSGKFHLGAKVHSAIDNLNIREGISSPFKVKDQRGESYKKHHPPNLHDDVWRLEKIAKNGSYHTRLMHSGVSSVQALLRMYYTDHRKLRSLLPTISNRTWDCIIEHATSCILDEQKYVFGPAEGSSLLFNNVFQVIGVSFDGENFQSVDHLSPHEKEVVEKLRQIACMNVDALVPVTAPVPRKFNNEKSGLVQDYFQCEIEISDISAQESDIE